MTSSRPSPRAKIDAKLIEPSLAEAWKPIVHDAIRQDRRRRRRRLALPIFILVSALILAAITFYSKYSNDIDREQRTVSTLQKQVVDLGGTPQAGPTGSPGAAGRRGPAPTAAQIATAVAGYCSLRSGCVGVPSRAQVTAAVKAFCATGACRGKTGATGRTGASRTGPAGESGASGAPGVAGPGPTSDQISSAIAAYCGAHGGCTGPAGPKGDTGATGVAGVAGRGITSIDCAGLGLDQLTINYDDGTAETVTCNSGSAPTDQPSASPTP